MWTIILLMGMLFTSTGPGLTTGPGSSGNPPSPTVNNQQCTKQDTCGAPPAPCDLNCP